jgi:hypothetical protein
VAGLLRCTATHGVWFSQNEAGRESNARGVAGLKNTVVWRFFRFKSEVAETTWRFSNQRVAHGFSHREGGATKDKGVQREGLIQAPSVLMRQRQK